MNIVLLAEARMARALRPALVMMRRVARRGRLPTVEELAQAMFDSNGCEQGPNYATGGDNRCPWGKRPCCCQERYMEIAHDARRGLERLQW